MTSRRRATGGSPSGGAAPLVQRGLKLHQAGDIEAAASLYTQALGLDAAHPEANHLLGVVRLGQQRLDEALSLLAKAVSLDGRNPQYLANMGVALNAARRYEAATESLDRALRLRPDFAEAYSNRGMAYRALGRFDDAVQSYEEAIRLKPGQAGFYFNLANSLDDAGRPHEALAALDKALSLKPGHTGALAAKVRLLQELRRFHEAAAMAEAAVKRAPESPEVRASLASIMRRTGKLAEALQEYRRVIELKPSFGLAHYNLSYGVVHEARDAEFDSMARVFRDEKLSREDRSLAGFALGKALADIGEHQESHDVYLEANALRRLDQPYSLAEALQQMDRILNDFAHVPPALVGAGYTDAAPTFVVGLPRAGKSTVEGILAKSPSAWPGGELGQLRRAVVELGVKPGTRGLSTVGRQSLSRLTPQDIREGGRKYAEYVDSIGAAGGMVIDTMPTNFLLIGYIRLMLPNARIIHPVRDPLDHVVAIFEKCFARPVYGYTYRLEDLVAYYSAYRRLMAFWEEQAPGQILTVQVPDLRADPAAVRELYEFCGLDWHEGAELVPESEQQIGQRAPAVTRAQRLQHLECYRAELARLVEAHPR